MGPSSLSSSNSETALTRLGAGTRLLVIILNFNGIDDTLACLGSLASQTLQNFHVLVIDNGSRGDDPDRIRTRSPATEVIALPGNLGWAGGNNVGLRLALSRGFDFVCLLNNDTVLDPVALEELLLAAGRIGRPCLLHPAIAFFDDPTQWQLYPEPSTSTDAFVRQLEAAHEICEMTYAYGACMLFAASALRVVGLLDDRFFLQFEETDYFQRAPGARDIQLLCAARAHPAQGIEEFWRPDYGGEGVLPGAQQISAG